MMGHYKCNKIVIKELCSITKNTTLGPDAFIRGKFHQTLRKQIF